jgi:hypothetical protein
MPEFGARQGLGEKAVLLACFAGIVLVAKFALISHFGNATPYWDQWDAEADRLYRPWLENLLRLKDLLAPHNEHRILTTRLLALALLEINGRVWNPILQMQVNAFLHVLALSVFLLCLGKPLPRGYRIALFAFTAVLFCIPFGWENTLAGFQSQFYFLLLFSFVFLWAMSAYQTGSGLWWLGVLCGVLSWLSLASGATTLLAGAAILLIRRYLGKEREIVALWPVLLLVVMALAAVAITPSIAWHVALKARSLGQFIESLARFAAWPENGVVFGSPVLQLPLLLTVVVMLWNKKFHAPGYIFPVGVAIWLFGQEASLAYGRTFALAGAMSRYTDLFAIGLVLNCFALLMLACNSAARVRYRYAIGGVVWLGLVTFGFDVAASGYEAQLRAKALQGAAQEDNVRRYLCTGDVVHLQHKQMLAIPYPSAERLKALLDDRSVRSILPGNIYVENSSSGDTCSPR